MRKKLTVVFSLSLLALTISLFSPKGVFACPLAQDGPPTSAQVIEAVNGLRLIYGLPPLNAHPVLMQIAQTEADGIAAGMPGHWRPNNLTLGQWMLSLGYPLLGDLSMDGYRSENFSFGDASTITAIENWRGDDIHTNTMLSTERSDIGAGVAKLEDGSYVFVIETALQTRSGKMQWDAYPILTAIASGQVAAYGGDATQAAQSLLVPQYIMPVVRATARPDGDVIHEVKNGQSMWSIATGYGVKIDQIQRLNNLADTEIYPGQKLLVQKGATQPVPTAMLASTPHATVYTIFPTATVQQNSPTPSVIPLSTPTPPGKTSIAGIAAGLVLLAVLLAGLVTRFSAQRVV